MADSHSKAEYDQRWHDAWQQGVPPGRVSHPNHSEIACIICISHLVIASAQAHWHGASSFVYEVAAALKMSEMRCDVCKISSAVLSPIC